MSKRSNSLFSTTTSTNNSSPLIIPVELISDTLCPNGYIGKKHLQKAIHEILTHPNPHAPKPISFSVLRVPYFLEPQYDESRPFIESNRERLVKKWGGNAGWERQKNNHDLKGRGEAAGIPHFNLDRLTSNTMASHRLIQHVGKKYGLRVSEGLYDKLNVYYFVDGFALNDRPRLATVAHECIAKLVLEEDGGVDVMSKEEILDFLNSDKGTKEIHQALDALKQMGVHGIPKFVIEGRRVVDGAAHSDVFIDIFRDIEESGEVYSGPIFAEMLGVSPEVLEKGSHTRDSLQAA